MLELDRSIVGSEDERQARDCIKSPMASLRDGVFAPAALPTHADGRSATTGQMATIFNMFEVVQQPTLLSVRSDSQLKKVRHKLGR